MLAGVWSVRAGINLTGTLTVRVCLCLSRCCSRSGPTRPRMALEGLLMAEGVMTRNLPISCSARAPQSYSRRLAWSWATVVQQLSNRRSTVPPGAEIRCRRGRCWPLWGQRRTNSSIFGQPLALPSTRLGPCWPRLGQTSDDFGRCEPKFGRCWPNVGPMLVRFGQCWSMLVDVAIILTKLGRCYNQLRPLL